MLSTLSKTTQREIRELGESTSQYLHALISNSCSVWGDEEYLSGIIRQGNVGEVWVVWYREPTRSTFLRMALRVVREARRQGLRKLTGQTLESNATFKKLKVYEDSISYIWEKEL